MEETIYLIPTNPEFYGAKTEEEAARCAGVLMQELSVHIIEQGYPVEFQKAGVSSGCRGYGDEDIISEIESLEREHLAEWLNGVIQSVSFSMGVCRIAFCLISTCPAITSKSFKERSLTPRAANEVRGENRREATLVRELFKELILLDAPA